MNNKFKIYHKKSNRIFPINGIIQIMKYDVLERLEKVVVQDYLPYNENDDMCWQHNELNGHECLIIHSTTKIDSDKKELFEGDVIEDNVGRRFFIEFDRKNYSFMAYYIKDIKQKQYLTDFISSQEPLKKIGNKFTNPELLKS